MRGLASKLNHPGIRATVKQVCWVSCLFLIILGGLLLQMPAQAEPVMPPKTCQLGVYLTSLRDFNPAEKSFAVNFWIWSICPLDALKPLESLKVINSKEVSINYISSSQSENQSDAFKARKNVFWSEQEISAIFYHNWDTRNYPFDRHVLRISLEETKLEASDFVYTPDYAGSGYQKDIDMEGWKITNFKIAQMKFPYQTSFGNPGIKRALNDRSRLTISITINRQSKVSFFKLTAGVYAAVALSIMTLLLDDDFGDRMGIFVGTLFAVLVNMQVATSDLGSTDSITLIDFIHIIAMVYIFISAILLVYTRFLSESKKPSRYLMRRFAVPILSGSFIVLNIVAISYAAIVG